MIEIVKKINFKNKKGFTLVELAIYMGILMILLVVLTDILSSILNVTLSTQSTSSVARDGRYIYSRFIYDINRAQSASSPAALGDISQSLQLTLDGQSYEYGLSGTDLVLSDGTGSYILNSPDTGISDLQFKRIGNVNGKHTFQINFDVTSKIRVNNKFESTQFQTTAGFR